MRQASWIAFLLLTMGLLTYDAAISQGTDGATVTTTEEPSPEANKGDGGMWPPKP